MANLSGLVRETSVHSVRTLMGPENRTYRELLITGEGISGQPGQFVMIRRNQGPNCWAYPYLLQSCGTDGFTVCAVEGTSLFDAEPGTPLVVWGPSGKAVTAEGPAVLVLEGATAFLGLPFLQMDRQMPFVALMPRTAAGCLADYPGGVFVSSVEEAAATVGDRTVIGALNVETVQRLARAMGRTDRLYAFASTRISCGVNGCKSCYLHSKDLPLGFPVCCNGPYLPYDAIDFEADIRCFHTFV